MCPVIFQWGFVSVYSWPVMYVIAILTAIYISARLDKSLCLGIGRGRITCLYIVAGLGALIGAQIFQWLILLVSQANTNNEGRAYYGGVIVVIVLIIIASRRWQLSAYKLLDMAFIAQSLGGAIGRIGCLLNGCCRGDAVKQCWFAIKYPIIPDEKTFPTLLDLIFGIRWREYLNSFRGDAYVHPAPLYYSIGFLLIFLVLYFRRKQMIQNPGNIFYIWLSLHGILRFLLEMVRDNPPYILGKLNISGLMSIISFVVGVLALTFRNSKWF